MSPTLEQTTRVSSRCPATPASRPSCSGRAVLPLGAVVAPAETSPFQWVGVHRYGAGYSGCPPVATVDVPCIFSGWALELQWKCPVILTYPRAIHRRHFPVSGRDGVSSIVFIEICSTTRGSGSISRDLPVLECEFAPARRWLQWVHRVSTVDAPRNYSGLALYFQWVTPVSSVGVPCNPHLP